VRKTEIAKRVINKKLMKASFKQRMILSQIEKSGTLNFLVRTKIMP